MIMVSLLRNHWLKLCVGAVVAVVGYGIITIPYPVVDCILASQTMRKASETETAIFTSACEGNPVTQTGMGLIYLTGRYVDASLSEGEFKASNLELDQNRGLRWLRTAAANGHADAKYYIAIAIKNIDGLDTVEGYEYPVWLSSASVDGSAMARRTFGQAYLYGDQDLQIPKDIERGLELLHSAAELGDEGALEDIERWRAQER